MSTLTTALALMIDSADAVIALGRAGLEIDFNLPGSPDAFGPIDMPGLFPPAIPGPGDPPIEAGPPDDPSQDDPDTDCDD